MSISVCGTEVNEQGYEMLEHGTVAFPIACYHDNLYEKEVPWHWHEELELAIVTEGTILKGIGNQEYRIEKGEGFFVNAGILHGVWDFDQSHSRLHSMAFHPMLVSGKEDSIFHRKYMLPILQHLSLEGLHLKPESQWEREILDSTERVWQAVSREEEGYEFVVREELSKIIFQIYKHALDEKNSISRKEMKNSIRIKQMLQWIHEHFEEKMSVEDIAAAAMIGKSECLRCFKQTINISPMQYVKQYRIRQACKMLKSTENTIGDIAFSCGFHDVSYFTKTFREEMHMTPGDYRDEVRM